MYHEKFLKNVEFEVVTDCSSKTIPNRVFLVYCCIPINVVTSKTTMFKLVITKILVCPKFYNFCCTYYCKVKLDSEVFLE